MATTNKHDSYYLRRNALRSLSTVGPKRGSPRRREVATIIQRYSPPNRVSNFMSLAIYIETRGRALLSCATCDILSNVLLESYVDVVQMLRPLRWLVKMNGARLCNCMIGKPVALKAFLILSGRINGWFILKHQDLNILERYVLDKKNQTFNLMWFWTGKVILQATPVNKEGKVLYINSREVVLNCKLAGSDQEEGILREFWQRELI
ncbi:hypothetical protein N431DRAFT_498710 [Stipitochalara longipes BDJ]|nr:hypothetical protein N431DRAFT_498710 [Stipitochalara longipes BDJ]